MGIARKNKKKDKKKREFWHCLPIKKKKKVKKKKTNIHMNFSKTNVVGKYSFNALKKKIKKQKNKKKKELYPFRQKMGILRLLRKFPSGPRRPVKLTEGTDPTGSHPQGIDDIPKFDPICDIFFKNEKFTRGK